MDTQLKKGLLEICTLKVISTNPTYGYEIIKKLSDVVEVSESTLYPILKRLEKSNYLTTYQEVHNSRLRKYYQITPEGLNRIEEFKHEWQSVIKIYEFIEEDTNAN